MAASPRFKIYLNGEYVGSAKDATTAAMFVAALGEPAEVRAGHKRVVWTEGTETFSAGESFDGAADEIERRSSRRGP